MRADNTTQYFSPDDRETLGRLLERTEHLDDCIDTLKTQQKDNHEENSERLRKLEDSWLVMITKFRTWALIGSALSALIGFGLHLLFKS